MAIFTNPEYDTVFSSYCLFGLVNEVETDVSLITRNNRLVSAHKMVLSSVSDFVKTLCRDHDTIILPDVECEVVTAFISLLYTGQAALKDTREVLEFVDLTNMLGVSLPDNVKEQLMIRPHVWNAAHDDCNIQMEGTRPDHPSRGSDCSDAEPLQSQCSDPKTAQADFPADEFPMETSTATEVLPMEECWCMEEPDLPRESSKFVDCGDTRDEEVDGHVETGDDPLNLDSSSSGVSQRSSQNGGTGNDSCVNEVSNTPATCSSPMNLEGLDISSDAVKTGPDLSAAGPSQSQSPVAGTSQSESPYIISAWSMSAGGGTPWAEPTPEKFTQGAEPCVQVNTCDNPLKEGNSSHSQDKDYESHVFIEHRLQNYGSNDQPRMRPTTRPYRGPVFLLKKLNVINNPITDMPKSIAVRFKCAHCEVIFSSNGDLMKHLRIHVPRPIYHCSQCTRLFNDQESLKRHLKAHKSKHPCPRSQCDQRFNSKDHSQLHRVDCPYHCSKCDKTFKYKRDLDLHFKLHSGDFLNTFRTVRKVSVIRPT